MKRYYLTDNVISYNHIIRERTITAFCVLLARQWWVRSAGNGAPPNGPVRIVMTDGNFNTGNATNTNRGVRPALFHYSGHVT